MHTNSHEPPGGDAFRRVAALVCVISSIAIAFTGCATAAPTPNEFAGATPLQWSMRMAESQMKRSEGKLAWQEGGRARWDYTAGLFTLSLLKLNEQTNCSKCVSFAEQAIGSFITSDGNIRGYKKDEYQLDAINPGKTVLALWQITKDERYKKCAEMLRHQFETQPRTSDGGFWHKERYTNQMWLDGLYMGAPFLAECGKLFNEPADYDEAAKQIRLMDQHSYDPKSGLFYHAWDAAKVQPWANPTTGCSSNFWGRAIGWWAMALVDSLDFIPQEHPARKDIIATLNKLCAGVVKHQDASGLWWQVMDQPNREGNYLEATASAMFVCSLSKAVNTGYIPHHYAAAARKGYDGMLKQFIRTEPGGSITLTHCCSVAGLGFKNSKGMPRDGSFGYYISEPVVENDLKGIGPFILAGIELQQLRR